MIVGVVVVDLQFHCFVPNHTERVAGASASCHGGRGAQGGRTRCERR
jgi:hypothetical protein